MHSSTSKNWLVVTAAAASLPPPASGSDGGSIDALKIEGRHGDSLEVRLTASGGEVTITDVKVHLYEDGSWSTLAQAGVGDVAFDALTIAQDASVRFTVGNPGRAARLAVSAALSANSIAVAAKRNDRA